MTKKILPLIVFLLILLFCIPAKNYAQTEQIGLATEQIRGASVNYYYAKPGDLTITVSIWGFVQKPGLYEIASSTNLVHVISLAGGPANYAKMDKIKIIRLKKENNETKKVEVIVDLDELKSLSKDDLELHPGDTILVDHTGWFTVKDVFSITSSVAVLITATASLLRLFN